MKANAFYTTVALIASMLIANAPADAKKKYILKTDSNTAQTQAVSSDTSSQDESLQAGVGQTQSAQRGALQNQSLKSDGKFNTQTAQNTKVKQKKDRRHLLNVKVGAFGFHIL